MFDGMLPEWAVVAEADAQAWESDLWPAEMDAARNFSAKRFREFAAGRDTIRSALRALGNPSVAIPMGPGREPLLPEGVVGSLTHTENYCAAAVMEARHGLSIGIDAECAHVLEEGVIPLILNPTEQHRATQLRKEFGDESWELIVFSAKESFQKALYRSRPILLNFLDIEVALHPQTGIFNLTASKLEGLQPLLHRSCAGRFRARDALILTTFTLPIIF